MSGEEINQHTIFQEVYGEHELFTFEKFLNLKKNQNLFKFLHFSAMTTVELVKQTKLPVCRLASVTFLNKFSQGRMLVLYLAA